MQEATWRQEPHSNTKRWLNVVLIEVMPEVIPRAREHDDHDCGCGRGGPAGVALPCAECSVVSSNPLQLPLLPSTEDHQDRSAAAEEACAHCEELRRRGNAVGAHACYEMLEYDSPSGSLLHKRAVQAKVMIEAQNGWGTFTLRRYLDLPR